MSTRENPAEQWLKADDPIAAVMADVRVVSVLRQDLDKEAKRPGLNPMEAQKIEAVSWDLRERLRQASTFVDQYATSVGAPAERNYLLGTEPEAYPKDKPLEEKMKWFLEEGIRLEENINRRLNVNRAAQAELALKASAEKGEEPARLRNAASQIMDNRPYLGHLLKENGLPATRMMLNDVNAKLLAQQQTTGKLRKKNPRVAAAEARSEGLTPSASVKRSPTSPRAKAAALTTSRAASPAGSDAAALSDWERNKLHEAMVTIGTLGPKLQHNPFAAAIRSLPEADRGRSRERTASVDSRTRSHSPERSPSPRRR